MKSTAGFDMSKSHEQQKHTLLGWQAQGGPPRLIPTCADIDRLRRSDFGFRQGENRNRTHRFGEDYRRSPGGKSARRNRSISAQVGISGDLYQFGRRIEADGSWTIYHVFTGTPAHIGSWTMTGLNRRNAEKALTILNTH
jgi:hypothetical protein